MPSADSEARFLALKAKKFEVSAPASSRVILHLAMMESTAFARALVRGDIKKRKLIRREVQRLAHDASSAIR